MSSSTRAGRGVALRPSDGATGLYTQNCKVAPSIASCPPGSYSEHTPPPTLAKVHPGGRRGTTATMECHPCNSASSSVPFGFVQRQAFGPRPTRGLAASPYVGAIKPEEKEHHHNVSCIHNRRENTTPRSPSRKRCSGTSPERIPDRPLAGPPLVSGLWPPVEKFFEEASHECEALINPPLCSPP